MDKLLEGDIVNRASILYNYFSGIIKKCMPSKWYNSSLEFEINENKEINGMSWCENDVDHVEINSGVVELYYDYFKKVMKYDKVEFLKFLNQKEDENVLKKMSYEGIYFREGIPEMFDSKLVDDGKARLLEIFVSRFIVLHELGHIFNGHCKFLANELHIGGLKLAPLYYNESEMLLNEDSALDIRTMEMDADAFAATQSMQHAIFLYFNFDNQVKVKIKPDSLFYWWAFAMRSHFLTCEDKFMDNTYYKKMTHLPSNARWTMIYISVMEVLDFYDITTQDKEKFKGLLTKGAIDAEEKFNSIKCSNYSWINEVDGNGEYIKYRDDVNRNWDKMKVQLQKYSRLSLFGE